LSSPRVFVFEQNAFLEVLSQSVLTKQVLAKLLVCPHYVANGY
jgi:hypothetical protein